MFNVKVNSNRSTVCIGGMVAYANATTVAGSISSLTLVNTKSDNFFDYVGGVMAYFDDTSKSGKGIMNSISRLSVSNVKIRNLGGLVGYATYITIDNCSTTGEVTYNNINYSMNLGGIVGTARGSSINNSGTNIEFNITIASSADKFIGAMAGALENYNGTTTIIQNYYVVADNYGYLDETIYNVPNITLGACGKRETGISITQKE